MKRLRSVPSALVAGALLVVASLGARAADYEEYQVKARFLLNFARLVEWPAAARPDRGQPLIVGLHGDAQAADSIASALRGAQVNGHAVRVKSLETPDEIAGCHIVFVAMKDSEEALAWAGAAPDQTALTVGESSGFAGHGGVINFFVEGKKLRFEINKHAADRKGLKISSRLLRLARLVPDER